MPLRRAFTLLEVLIASVVFLIVVVASLGLLTSTDKTVGASLKITDLVLRADRLASRVRDEMTQATNLNLNETNTQVPGANNWTTVTYEKVDRTTTIDPTSGLPNAGTTIPRQLRFRYEEGPDNAAPLTGGNNTDDDNDGLIDEGVLELWEGAVPALVGVLGRDISSAAEQYEPGAAPWVLYPSGTRGGVFSFQFDNAAISVGSGQRALTFRFTIVGRLPVRATKGTATTGTFHHEQRTVSVAFRATSN